MVHWRPYWRNRRLLSHHERHRTKVKELEEPQRRWRDVAVMCSRFHRLYPDPLSRAIFLPCFWRAFHTFSPPCFHLTVSARQQTVWKFRKGNKERKENVWWEIGGQKWWKCSATFLLNKRGGKPRRESASFWRMILLPKLCVKWDTFHTFGRLRPLQLDRD